MAVAGGSDEIQWMFLRPDHWFPVKTSYRAVAYRSFRASEHASEAVGQGVVPPSMECNPIHFKDQMASLTWNSAVLKLKRFCMELNVAELTWKQFVRIHCMSYLTFSKLKAIIAPYCTRRERFISPFSPTVPFDFMLHFTLRLLAGSSYTDVY